MLGGCCLFGFVLSFSMLKKQSGFFFFLDENGFHLKIYCLMLLIPSNLVTVIVLLLMLVFEERHIFNGMER